MIIVGNYFVRSAFRNGARTVHSNVQDIWESDLVHIYCKSSFRYWKCNVIIVTILYCFQSLMNMKSGAKKISVLTKCAKLFLSTEVGRNSKWKIRQFKCVTISVMKCSSFSKPLKFKITMTYWNTLMSSLVRRRNGKKGGYSRNSSPKKKRNDRKAKV